MSLQLWGITLYAEYESHVLCFISDVWSTGLQWPCYYNDACGEERHVFLISVIFSENNTCLWIKGHIKLHLKIQLYAWVVTKFMYDVDRLSAAMFAQFRPVSEEALDQLVCPVWSLWVVYVC